MPSLAREGVGSWLVPVALALCGAFFVVGITGQTSRLMQSHHGLLHSAAVYQLLNGIWPPTSPLSMGAPSNYLTAYHMILAFLVRIFEVTPFEVSLALNSMTLAVVLVATWMATGLLTRETLLRLSFCLLPFFLLNPVGTVSYGGGWLLTLLGADPPALATPWTWTLTQFQLLGIDLDPKPAALLMKFLNFNAMPLGVAFFVILMHLTVSGGGWARSGLCATLGSLAAFVYPPAAPAVGLVALAVLGVEGFEAWRARRAPSLAAIAPAAAAALAVLVASALQLNAAGPARATFSARGASEVAVNAVRVGWALLPALPVYVIAAARLPKLSRQAQAHWLAGLLLAVACALMPLAGNEYKFAHFYAFPSSLLLLAFVGALPRSARRLGAGVALFAGLLSFLATGMLYLSSSWARQHHYVYAGATIEIAPTGPLPSALGEAYQWLRTHTPVDAFVIERPLGMNQLRLSTVAQRRVVAARAQKVFTGGIPYQKELAAACADLVGSLESCRLDPKQLERLFRIPAPWPDRVYALSHRSPGAGNCRLPPGVHQGFANEHFVVVEIETGADAGRSMTPGGR